jgi:hypothetical protein
VVLNHFVSLGRYSIGFIVAKECRSKPDSAKLQAVEKAVLVLIAYNKFSAAAADINE